MRKPIRWTLAAAGLVAVLVTAVVLGVRALSSGASTAAAAPECTVPPAGTGTNGSAVYLAAVQLQHAATINAVGIARGLPARARVIALATAYQESGLRNLPGGDRDSVGLFQQRPSQGWGTARQIADPVYAAGKFYDALLHVAGWQRLPLTRAAQAVQFSAFPDAYARWEPQATTLAAALGGSGSVQLSCNAGAQRPTADAPVRPPLAGTAGASVALAALLAAAQAELGGVRVVAVTGPEAVVAVTLTAMPAAQAGRVLAAWAVAHATGFGVTAVSVGGQLWTGGHWAAAPTIAAPGRVAITAP